MNPLTRREFMKTLGVGLASLVIASCKLSSQKPSSTSTPVKTPTSTQVITCYVPVEQTATPTPNLLSLSPRDRLRVCWLSFNELAAKTLSGENSLPDNPDSDRLGTQLIADHRLALDALVAAGEIEPAVADLVQEAYAAAVYHVWRSNVPITCYEPMMVDYAPTSAAQLVQQSAILADMATRSDLDPETVALAQQTLQHDLAFEALSREQVDALYQKLIEEYPKYSDIPSFDHVDLAVTPEMEAAAQFLVDLLSETP
jgi:hypothetical protein